MDASERSQLSAIALLIVRATLWLLPGFFSRHFIEGIQRFSPRRQCRLIAGILFPALH